MPWEYVGECGSGSYPQEAAWVDYCLDAGLNYLRFSLGDPPTGCELGIMMNDHDLGSYPSIGVYWSFPVSDAPWNYINSAEELLSEFNKAVAWDKLYPLPNNPI